MPDACFVWVAALRCLRRLKADFLLAATTAGNTAAGIGGQHHAVALLQCRSLLAMCGALSYRDVAPAWTALARQPQTGDEEDLLFVAGPLWALAAGTAPPAAQVQLMLDVLRSAGASKEPRRLVVVASLLAACWMSQACASHTADAHVALLGAESALRCLPHTLPLLLATEQWSAAGPPVCEALGQVMELQELDGSCRNLVFASLLALRGRLLEAAWQQVSATICSA